MKKLGSLIFALSLLFMSSAMVSAAPVDINKASAEELVANLKGIGPVKAKAIVLHREKHGPFKSIEELSAVKGIGLKTLDANRANLKGLTSASSKSKADSKGKAKTKDQADSKGKAKSKNQADSKDKAKAKGKEKSREKESSKSKSNDNEKEKNKTKSAAKSSSKDDAKKEVKPATK